MNFSELLEYFRNHPLLCDLPLHLTGLDVAPKEYATLSKAVHASAVDFRMTDKASAILLWSCERKKSAMWASREAKVIEIASLLLACLFVQELQGTKRAALRQMLYFALGKRKRDALKKTLKIAIAEP